MPDHVAILRRRAAMKSIYVRQRDELLAAADAFDNLRATARDALVYIRAQKCLCNPSRACRRCVTVAVIEVNLKAVEDA